MSIHTHQSQFSNARSWRIVAGAALAGLFALYAPAANAGDLLGGLHSLFGHHPAGTIYRAADYDRTPRSNYAPAYAAPYTMATTTIYAPYQPFVDGGSVVYDTPMVMKKSHGHGTATGPLYAPAATPAPKNGLHMGQTYVRLKGVNRKTYSCTGYEGRPESFACVEKSSEYIPRQGPWRAVGN